MTKNKYYNSFLGRLKHSLKKDVITQIYSEKDRYIPQQLWMELKRIHVCQRCKKRFPENLEIHHKVSVKDGGGNTKDNLMVVCKNCHYILNQEQVKKE